MDTPTTRPRIFVQLASYRDPECQPTLDGLFAQAAHPERINVGLCLQIDPETDTACVVTPKFPVQTRIKLFHYDESKGANWARAQAQSLWQGEEYVLQIDSHMRFAAGWDDALIAMLARCGAEKPAISGCPPGYRPPDAKDIRTDETPRICVEKFGGLRSPQLLHLKRLYVPVTDKERAGLTPTPFCLAGFLFARASLWQDIPIDTHIVFWGDEITYSARLWTHGYDVFQPDQDVIFHYWKRHELASVQPYRRVDTPQSRQVLARVRHLLGLAATRDADALDGLERYGLGSVRPLDALWLFAGVDWQRRQLTKDATEGKWNMAARQKKTGSGKPDRQLPRIFVQIPSYRDRDCQHTVHDLFKKAAHPERIFVGICWQYVKGEDDDCFTVPYPYPKQVRVFEVPAKQSRGLGWARSQTQKLWRGEEFTLSMDAHMHFEPGWDELLLSMWRDCGNEKAVLTCYPPGFTPPDSCQRDWLFGMSAKEFDGDGIFLMHGVPSWPKDNLPAKPVPGAFAGDCMLFGPASIIRDVPFDPYIYFFGQEISLAVRLWTSGYDLFHPNKFVVFHDWHREKRTTHFDDHNWVPANARSYARVRHLLGTEVSHDQQALVDIEYYGLGTVRTLAEYQRFSGVDFAAKTIGDKAHAGIYETYVRPSGIERLKTAAAPKLIPENRPRIFVNIASYRDRECQWTIKDLFEKASFPDRIQIGVCWQFDEITDRDCFRVTTRAQQVRVYPVDWREAEGVCWARAQAQALWDGEEYALQIDAHMRFVPGWDELMIRELAACPSAKPVLSCNPAPYIPPGTLTAPVFPSVRRVKPFDIDGNLRGTGEWLKRTPEEPLNGAFIAGAFVFSRAALISEVPYDPYLYFDQEESSYALRLFTHGWDIFSARTQFLYHYYNNDENPVRPLHWQDVFALDPARLTAWQVRGIKRFNHLTGYALSDDPDVTLKLDKFGLGKVRSLEQFEDYSGVDFRRKIASEKALRCLFIEGLQKYTDAPIYIPELDGPQAAVDMAPIRPRIFVNIASYRDPECQWTVKDLFEKATHPERVFVGICWQFDEVEDKHCFEIATRPDQVRVFPIDWREAEGVCWARHMTQQLWDSEEYTLMLDSHMRFMPGWDELMLAELAACDSAKPVLSAPPPPYTPPSDLRKNPKPAIRCVRQFTSAGNIRCRGEYLDRSPEKPLRGAFVVANFVFSRSDIISDVPYDPYLYFDQEEITYSLRLYTHGWDLFHPRQPMLYHYYNDLPEGTTRPLHWDDLKQEDEKKRKFYFDRGLKRFNHLTGHTPSQDPEITKEISSYGLGRVRSQEQFEAHTGVDFKRKIASEKALRALFIQDLQKYRDRPISAPVADNTTNVTAPIKSDNVTTGVAASIIASVPPPVGIRMLEPGDFVPMFTAPDADDVRRAIEIYGGRFILLFYLPIDNPDYVAAFLSALQKAVAAGDKMDSWQIFLFDGTPAQLKSLKERLNNNQNFWADPDRAIARAFGLPQEMSGSVKPMGFVLNRNLKIVSRRSGLTPVALAEAIAGDGREEMADYRHKNREPHIVSEVPPMLIVPNALSPALCEKLINAFRTGKTYEGTVGAPDKAEYRPSSKVRTDFIVGGELLAEVDEKLSASLFPEMKKIFGVEITNRELYKVGLYTGEKAGFFKQHRDNFELGLGYRRIATTIHLSDNYEGGGLHFPEYDNNIYRPARGSAIAFSCGTLHEALPVTKGERFILVAFVHGDEDEAYRQYYQASINAPPKLDMYDLKRKRDYSELAQSRDFIADWRKAKVRFTTETAGPLVTGRALSTGPMVSLPATGKHQPKKLYESEQGMVFDDFMPEALYEKLHEFAVTTKYEYINTHKISQAWHVHDGFPLRSTLNAFYYAEEKKPKADYAYPLGNALDAFFDQMLASQPQVEHLVGKKGAGGWKHFSVTSWLYPHGTGLSFHDDGSGIYTGAYVYFLNPVWRPHWGGLLLLADAEANRKIYEHRSKNNETNFYRSSWLHANPMDELLMEEGFAKCIFPKRNRIVFIANNAYHMVTRVNEQSGDNLRMSFAGFFDKGEKK